MKTYIRLLILITIGAIALASQKNHVTDEEVLAWASQAAVESYSYDAISYKSQFSKLKTKFTENGWNNFKDALDKSGNLDAVINNEVVVSAYRNNPAEIESYSNDNNTSTWVVKVPTQVTYINGHVKLEQDMDTYVTIGMKDNSFLIHNLNSSLVAPTRSAEAKPVPRPNCKMATNPN